MFKRLRMSLGFGYCPRYAAGHKCKGQHCETGCDWYKLYWKKHGIVDAPLYDVEPSKYTDIYK